jgi:two-component system cell cycle response regulator
MHDTQPSSPAPNTQQTVSATSGKPRVLVIDDSRLVRVSIKRALDSEFEILEAGDGEEGWEQLVADDKIQAVITDAGMPRLDGYGLIERIRADGTSHIKNIPIMMITGAEADQVDAREQALNLGATDFVTKPFDKTKLLARVRAYTRLDQTQRNLEDTEEALAEQSIIDKETGVHNRKYFVQRGEQDLAFARRHSEELSVIVIGIDNFGVLNKQHGDAVAQQLLSWSANMIKEGMRKEDTVARVAHSRFAIITPKTGRMAAAALCERIRSQFSGIAFQNDAASLTVSVSIGLSCFGRDNLKTMEEFLALAENRSEQAQRLGGNRTIASSEKEKASAGKALSVDTALHAIQVGQYDALRPFLLLLAQRVIPIIELCNEKLNWQIDEHIAAIKSKLHSQ